VNLKKLNETICEIYGTFAPFLMTRRKRRQTQRSRRAETAIDREPLRTVRTPVGLIHNAYTILEQGFVQANSKTIPLDSQKRQFYENIVENDLARHQLLCEVSLNKPRYFTGISYDLCNEKPGAAPDATKEVSKQV
jgi:hypothetical protein